MAKDWRCKIGIHDWEIVETHAEEGYFFDDAQFWDRKVCMRCGVKCDEITPRLEEIEEQKKRKKLAKEKYKGMS